jgi:hypothetical protein
MVNRALAKTEKIDFAVDCAMLVKIGRTDRQAEMRYSAEK